MSEEKKKIIQELPKDFDIALYPKDQKGNYIIPDELFDNIYKLVPDGTINESRTIQAYHGGVLKLFQKGDTELQRLGGKAVQAQLKQRRTFAEALEYMLCKSAKQEDIERLGLEKGVSNIEILAASAVEESKTGNVRALEFIRDTIGEKPVDKQEINADVMTHEEKLLLAKVASRVENS